MKLSSLSFLVLIACGGCSHHSAASPVASISPSSESREMRTAQLREKLKTVTVTDGISKSEAEIIAECYFYQKVGCGGFTGVRDGGDRWIVDGAFGFAAKPI